MLNARHEQFVYQFSLHFVMHFVHYPPVSDVLNSLNDDLLCRNWLAVHPRYESEVDRKQLHASHTQHLGTRLFSVSYQYTGGMKIHVLSVLD